jgi:hypothetical protein
VWFRLLYLIMVCLFRWLAVLACSKSAVAAELLIRTYSILKVGQVADLELRATSWANM